MHGKKTLGALALLIPTALAAGCSTSKPAASPSTQPSPVIVSAKGTYVPAKTATSSGSPSASGSGSTSTTAFAYDTALVPAGAQSEVVLSTLDGKMSVKLVVTGFVPNRSYGAHLHAKPCGVDPKDAGGHFQHSPDPAASQSPSVDDKYANPQNEVWLDFTTDASGNATATANEAWAPTGAQPRALVIHAEKTKTAAGVAGSAGARVSCLTVGK